MRLPNLSHLHRVCLNLRVDHRYVCDVGDAHQNSRVDRSGWTPGGMFWSVMDLATAIRGDPGDAADQCSNSELGKRLKGSKGGVNLSVDGLLFQRRRSGESGGKSKRKGKSQTAHYHGTASFCETSSQKCRICLLALADGRYHPRLGESQARPRPSLREASHSACVSWGLSYRDHG